MDDSFFISTSFSVAVAESTFDNRRELEEVATKDKLDPTERFIVPSTQHILIKLRLI